MTEANNAYPRPTLSDITLTLARLADRVAESTVVGVEPFVRYKAHRMLKELERMIPGFHDPPDQESAERYLVAAQAALTRGQDHEALARSFRGLACSPHDPRLWFTASQACFECGAIKDCLRYLDHVLWINPGHVRARQDLEAITGWLEEIDENPDEGALS